LVQQEIFGLVQDELSLLENELAAIIQSEDDIMTDMGIHLLRAGGKRLRPALYFLGAKAGKGNLADQMPAAVAIELIHMATLVHDDVLDNASTRRNLITANAKWGDHPSVLTGDYLFAKAFLLLAANNHKAALSILTKEICTICEGEIGQIRDSYRVMQCKEDYFVRIGKKTAGFIAVSCQLGALAAGLSAAEVEGMYQYGYAVGMAFQITDDILDVTASSEKIGKPAGNDLKQGVLTLPVLYALEQSSHSEELKSIITAKDMPEEKVRRCLDIVRGTEAVEYSYQIATDYLETARKSLPDSLPGEVRAALQTIADFIGVRQN